MVTRVMGAASVRNGRAAAYRSLHRISVRVGRFSGSGYRPFRTAVGVGMSVLRQPLALDAIDRPVPPAILLVGCLSFYGGSGPGA